jgi:26S proteasome regulatory subunit N10
MDTTDFMRNGDYAPTRLESQQDAVGVLISGKLGSNPENTVGLLAFGKR